MSITKEAPTGVEPSTHALGHALSNARIALAPFALALAMALASLWIFTRNNDFPLDYHPDEPGKVVQVMTPGEPRNFNHPLLMLEAANAVRKMFHVPREKRAVGIAGRWTSAGLAAITVLALALAGYSQSGYRGLLLCGGSVAFCPALDIYAHFFKEDTSLVAGMAVALLGAARMIATEQPRRQLAAAALMGFGCGAAISGKYVGIVTVAPCLSALFLVRGCAPRLLLSRAAAFAAPLAAGVLGFNWRAFTSFMPPRFSPAAWEKLTHGFASVTTGHEGLALPMPNPFLLDVTASEMLPHVWLFLGLAVLVLARRRAPSRWGVTLGAFFFAFAVALSWSAFPFHRYALPMTVLGYFVAGQAIAAALPCIDRPRWLRRAGLPICLCLIVLFQGLQCWRFDAQFADDSRQRLREWVALNLPATATVLAEDYTALQGPGDPWRHPDQHKIAARIVISSPSAYRSGTVGQLKAAGVDYIAVAEPRFERYFRPGIHGLSTAEQQDLIRYQRFYRELFARAELVWCSVPSPPNHAYLDPELRLYRLRGP
jgi:hypothetical protein